MTMVQIPETETILQFKVNKKAQNMHEFLLLLEFYNT